MIKYLKNVNNKDVEKLQKWMDIYKLPQAE